ncbi:MAG TPA: hypothetical protein VGJ28_07560 [Micromonosporaceae bacterium]
MGLFSKKSVIDEAWIRCTGLIVAADAPPMHAPAFGPESYGTITVLADVAGTGRRQLTAQFRFADEHWVVAGMDVPIAVDPIHPETFEVDWAGVLPMRQQVTLNHPALADPFAASRRIAGALAVAPSARTAAAYERFQAAVAQSASQPAPHGRVRGVAVSVSVRGRYQSGGSDPDGGTDSAGVSIMATSEAVLAVTVPGRSPYAVFVPKFKVPRKHLVLPGEAIPVAVSLTDPHDVEPLWREMPGLGDQIGARINDAMQANGRLVATLGAQMQAAQAQAMAGGAGFGSVPPAVRQTLIENLRRAMAYMPDPGARQMMVNQYRAMGIEIRPEELGL